MSIKKKFVLLEKVFIAQWGEYLKLHDELNSYRGREIGEDANKVNDLILNIQKSFVDMYPLMKFAIDNQAVLIKACHDYNKFIDDIRKAGAQEAGKVEA